MAKEIRFAPSFVSSYRDYEAEAHELVKKLIRSSLERIAAEQAQQEADQLMSWPLGKDFTIEKGLEAIDKFVKVNIIYADCILVTDHPGQVHCSTVESGIGR